MSGERLTSFSTEAEQAWLTGGGPEPVAPRDRAPLRAPVLLPRAGGAAYGRAASDVRVRVAGGAVLLEGPDAGVLARDVRRVVWLVDGGEQAARTPPVRLGYVVLDDGSPRGTAFRVTDWVPGAASGPGAALVRTAGFEALAHALGVPFEVQGHGAPLHWPEGLEVVRCRVRHRAAPAVVTLAGPVLGVLVAAALAGVSTVAAAAALASGLLVPAAVDVVLAVGRARTRRPPVEAWAATGSEAGVGVRGQGERQELVVVDARGWRAWLPGPQAGGAVSVAVVEEVLVLLDRDETVLVVLPVDDGVVRLLERSGVVVSRAAGTAPPPHVAVRAPGADGTAGEGASGLVSVVLTVLLLTVVQQAWAAALVVLAVLATLLTRPRLATAPGYGAGAS